MIKNKVCVERQINERMYQFLVPSEAAIQECIMVVDDIRKYLVEILQDAERKAAEASAAVVEESKPE